MIAGGPIVDESDDLIAELPVFEDLVSDQAAEVAASGNQDLFEADPRAPAPLEDLSHELTRRERQRNVQDQKDDPDRLRNFQCPGVAGADDDVGLDVQRRHHAEQHCEDAPDKDRKEIIHTRSTAAETIETLQKEAERHDGGDERQDVDVLPQRRNALGYGNDTGMEAERVGDDEGGKSEEGIRDDVKGDQQAVVSNHRRVSGLARLFTRSSI